MYAVAIAVLLIAPRTWLPEFYRPLFMAGISTLAIFLIALPGWIFRTQDKHKKIVLERCQLAIAFCMLANGLGGLGMYKLYKIGFEYDKLLHFIVPTTAVVFVTYFLVHWYHRSRRFALICAVLIVLIGAIAWEGWEVAQDRLFGTKTSGVYGEDYQRDTTNDILAGLGGAMLGAYLVLRKNRSSKRSFFI